MIKRLPYFILLLISNQPTGCPKVYARGPVAADHSKRTQAQWKQFDKKAHLKQTILSGFSFTVSRQTPGKATQVGAEPSTSQTTLDVLEGHHASPPIPSDVDLSTPATSESDFVDCGEEETYPPSSYLPTRSHSPSPMPTDDAATQTPSTFEDPSHNLEDISPRQYRATVEEVEDEEAGGIPRGRVGDDEDNGGDSWEDELQNTVCPAETVRDWNNLRTKIKNDLKKKSKVLTLSEINKLLILQNFATLRIKGDGAISASEQIAHQWHEGTGTHMARRIRTMAHFYQVFERLPDKTRGQRKGRTVLENEAIASACRDWLIAQTAGEFTPLKFQLAVNSTILPSEIGRAHV